MKKILAIVLAISCLLLFAPGFSYAAEIDELTAAFGKTMKDTQFEIEGYEKNITGETKLYSKVYSKDFSNMRFDMEIDGQPMRFVMVNEGAFMYIEKQNVMMPMPASDFSKINPASLLEKIKKAKITAGKDKNEKTYTYYDAENKLKTSYFIDPRIGAISKELKYNEKGGIISELNYKNMKFVKTDESFFTLPKDAVDASKTAPAIPEPIK